MPIKYKDQVEALSSLTLGSTHPSQKFLPTLSLSKIKKSTRFKDWLSAQLPKFYEPTNCPKEPHYSQE